MAKSTSRRVPTAKKKKKTAVYLSLEACQKLGAACVVEMKGQSELVEMLIAESLSGYSAQARGRRIGQSTVSTDPDVQQNLSEHPAA
jgi:hypothetical protein